MRKIGIVVVMIFMIILTSCSYIATSGDQFALIGISEFKRGEHLKAVDHLNKAIELGVEKYDLKEIYSILGNTYLELDMYEKAIENHKMAIEIDGEFYEAWVNLGIAYRQSGDFDSAEECYSIAIELNPDYAELHSSLGTLYILKNEGEKAVEAFELAISLDPTLSITYGNGALAYAMIGDFEKAEEFIKQAKTLGYKNYKDIEMRIEALK